MLRMGKVQRTIRSKTLKDALKNFIVKPIAQNCHVISLRCVWDVDQEDIPKASFNILSKSNEIQNKINEISEVVLYFSCLSAMKASELKKELIKNNPDWSEDDYMGEDISLPGKCTFHFFFNL